MCVCLLVFACVGVCVDLCMCVCWFRWYYLVVRCVYVCVLILMFLFALLCVLLFYIVCIWWCSPCVDTFFDGCVCPQGLGFVWLSYMCTWGWCDVGACMYMYGDYCKLVGFLLLCLFFVSRYLCILFYNLSFIFIMHTDLYFGLILHRLRI